MRKLLKYNSIWTILIGINILFMSCSSTPENLKVLPKDTNFVSVFDVYSVVKKGKLDEMSELKFFKTFKKEIRNENKKVSKLIDDLIEDPTISGINFNSDLFAYYINEAEDEEFICFSAEIKNEEIFSVFIEDLLDKSDIEFDVEKNENYKYTLIENEAVIGWDGKKAVLLIAENYESRKNLDLEVEILMELKEKDQITSNDKFNEFYNNKKDISIWFSTNLFEDNYKLMEVEKEIGFDITDNYISTYLNFGNNDISLLTQFTPNGEIQEIMKENDVWNNTFNNQLLNYFPKENYAALSVSLNPKSYYDILIKQDGFEKMQTEFKEEMEIDLKDLFENIKGNAIYSLFGFDNLEYTYMDWGYAFNENLANLLEERYEISYAGYLSPEDKELLNQGKTIQASTYNRKYCINIKNVLENGGSIETAISNDSKINWYDGGWDYGQYIETTTEEYLPLMGLAIDIKGDELVKKIIDKVPEDKINKLSNYYEFKFDDKYPTYLAYNKNVCFVTNDLKSIKAFKDGGYSKGNLGDSNISSDISKSNLFTFLNLNYEEYPKDIKKEIQNNQNDKAEKVLKFWNDFAKSIELKLVDKYSFEIKFNLKDSNNNSLNTIITTIDDNYKSLMSL